MKNKKKNFFKEFISSILDFNSYVYFFKNTLGRAFLYLIFISIILGTISYIRPLNEINKEFSKILSESNEKLPDFELKNGILDVKEKMPYTVHSSEDKLIVIDTTGETDKDILNDYPIGILVLKDKLISKTNFQTRVIEFSNLEGVPIDKNLLISMLPYMKTIVYISVIIPILFLFGSALYSALIVSIISTFLRTLIGIRVTFGELYKLSIYALTLPMILNTIQRVFYLNVSYFNFIYYSIALCYMWQALINVRKYYKSKMPTEQ